MARRLTPLLAALVLAATGCCWHRHCGCRCASPPPVIVPAPPVTPAPVPVPPLPATPALPSARGGPAV